MNIEYINPFITASTNIITEATGLSPIVGKVYKKDTHCESGNVVVLIGLTGKISGSAVMAFNREFACKIASSMMMGAPVPEFDEIAKSAIGELCNMILGNTATLFSKMGMTLDITPPTIFTGDNIILSTHQSIIECVQLNFDDGNIIELDISYIEE